MTSKVAKVVVWASPFLLWGGGWWLSAPWVMMAAALLMVCNLRVMGDRPRLTREQKVELEEVEAMKLLRAVDPDLAIELGDVVSADFACVWHDVEVLDIEPKGWL